MPPRSMASGAGGARREEKSSGTSEAYSAVAFDVRGNTESTILVADFNAALGDPPFFIGVARMEWGKSWLS